MQDNTRVSARLRKFIRQPELHAERYGAFHVTARDLDVLELVFRYRHVTADHIRALIPGSSQQLTRRLAGLFHHNYLMRYAPLDRMRFDLNVGSPVMAYGLDTKGWRALEQTGRVAADGDDEGSGGRAADQAMWRKDHTRRMGWFLDHHLAIANFHCVLELALRRGGERGLSLLEWDQGASVRGEVRLTNGGVYRVNPDAFFAIQDGAGVRNYFLEIDGGTEEQRRIEAKLKAYWWWLQSPAYKGNYHDHQRVAVLFVTTGDKRMANMMATLANMPKPNSPEYGGKGWFRFCREGDYALAAPESILAQIWRTVTREELVALV